MIFDRLMAERGYAVNACLVVAHPDDEALWFGGLLATVPFEWTVICCSIPRSDPERAWLFHNACDILGARSKLMPFEEIHAQMRVPGIVFEHLEPALEPFDVIVTHSMVGEYGHVHHQHIAAHLSKRYPEKTVHGGYGEETVGNFIVDLNETDMDRKLAAIRAYTHCAPADKGVPKGEALLRRYGKMFDLSREIYHGPA